jgi:sugar phosphate isomerase/epimerase
MFVACSTLCFANEPLESALVQMADLEFTRADVAIWEQGTHLKPSEVAAQPTAALHRIRDASPVPPVAFNVEVEAKGDEHLSQFHAVCRLAKQALVTSVTIQAAEIGTPFNTEVDRLRELVAIANGEAVLLSVETHVNRLTEDPDTAVELCRAVPGLGITLDPSHYICGPHQGRSYTQVIPYVSHVHLRDTSRDRMQVCVGQGEIEYGRIVGYLERYDYKRALSVEIIDTPENSFDRNTELRKLRRMLESLV